MWIVQAGDGRKNHDALFPGHVSALKVTDHLCWGVRT
jgi:hypothetical protein